MLKLGKRVIRVSSVDLGSYISILSVDSFDKLKGLQTGNEMILETDTAFVLLKEDLAFRFLKPQAKPKILRAEELLINPDASRVKATLSSEVLLAFAVQIDVPVFETPTEYIIPGDITLVAAKKEKEKVKEHV